MEIYAVHQNAISTNERDQIKLRNEPIVQGNLNEDRRKRVPAAGWESIEDVGLGRNEVCSRLRRRDGPRPLNYASCSDPFPRAAGG